MKPWLKGIRWHLVKHFKKSALSRRGKLTEAYRTVEERRFSAA
jgi:hypothetical protein